MCMKTTKMSFPSRIRGINVQAPARRMPGESRNLLRSRFQFNLWPHLLLVALSVFVINSLVFAEEKTPVFPTIPVEVYTIYTSLAVFWLAIIGLIVIIKMKLNEIERIQKLGIDKDDKDAPLLD